MWQLPLTRCLTPEEFEAVQRKEREGVDAEELTADAVEAEEEEQGARGGEGEASGGGSGGTNGGGKGRRRKGPTLKERLERCLRTERERLTFGKVCFLSIFCDSLSGMKMFLSCALWFHNVGDI